MMEFEDEDALITLGISIPVNHSEQSELHYLQRRHLSVVSLDSKDKYGESSVLSQSCEFCCLPSLLDPNLNIVGPVLSSNIPYEKSTFNSWNIEPRFMHILPLSDASYSERSILMFGGLNPFSVLKKEASDFEHEDFVLGSTIFQYVLNTGVWKYYGTMFEPRCYHACVLVDQYVYIIGGYSLLKRDHGEMLAVSSTDRLDLSCRQWKRCSSMITTRAAHAAVSYKACLYVFGGRSAQGKILSSVEVYYPDQDLWAEISILPQPCMGLSATCIKDSIWLLGGIISTSFAEPNKSLSSDVFSFTPSNNKWNEEESLPHPCAFSACVSNGDFLWLIGGSTFPKDSKKDTMVSCSSVLQLSLSTRSSKWKSVSSLLHPRHALSAILYDKSIYVMGGMESGNNCASNKVEVVNTASNISTECPVMPASVTGSASVFIQDSQSQKCMKCAKHYSQSEIGGTYLPEDCQCGTEREHYIDGFDTFYTQNGSVKDNNMKHTKDTSSTYFESQQRNKGFSDQTFMKCDGNLKGLFPHKSVSNLINIKEENHVQNKILSTNLQNIIKKSSDRSFTERAQTIIDPVSHKSVKDTRNMKEDLDHKNKLGSDFQNINSKSEDNQNVKYRASMEIILNNEMSDKNDLKTFVERKSSTAKWQKYFDTYFTSNENLRKEFLKSGESEESIKIYRKTRETYSGFEQSMDSYTNMSTHGKNQDDMISKCIQNSVPCRQSLLYVQSNLTSQPPRYSDIKDFGNQNLSSTDNVIKKDTLPVELSDMTKLCLDQEALPSILITGGEDPFDDTKGRYILSYYCSKDLWEYVGYMPASRCHHCTVFFNNSFYIIGGFDSAMSKDFEKITCKTICYGFSNQMWQDKASMNYPRAYHTAVICNDKIYVLGGRDQHGNILASVEAYDASKNEWMECQSLPYPILGAAAATVNGILHVFGGITYHNDEDEIISSRSVVYYPENNSWSDGPAMHTSLAFCGIATISNTVWLFGGLKEKDQNIISTEDVCKFDMLSSTWSKVAKLSISRHASVTVSLGSNVYIIGGHSTQARTEVTMCEKVDLLKTELFVQKSLPVAVTGKAGALITSFSSRDEKANITYS